LAQSLQVNQMVSSGVDNDTFGLEKVFKSDGGIRQGKCTIFSKQVRRPIRQESRGI
jgi:hypothetical protein